MTRFFFVSLFVFLLIGTTFSISLASAQSFGTGTTSFSGSSSYSSSSVYQSRASYQSSYSISQASTYWPILGDAATCDARQDLLLNVRPSGCQPVVVRSDLLAEQDVPVFCQVDSLNTNPLLEIGQIQNVRFSSDYPSEVAGVGWHPARAALRSNDLLLNSPLLNNIGYVVVVLKRQPNETSLPDSINLTLSAQLDYNAGNVLGVGSNEFLLKETIDDSSWETQKLKQSFWNGRYFVRVEESNDEFADVSIYRGDSRIGSTRVQKGTTSRELYVPGAYCQAGLQVAYDGLVAAKRKARIALTGDGGTEFFDVTEGTRFYGDRCSVSRIDVGGSGETGKVSGSCGGKSFVLELKPFGADLFKDFGGGQPTLQGGSYSYTVRSRGTFRFDSDNKLYLVPQNGQIVEWTDANGNAGASLSQADKDFAFKLWTAMKTFKESSIGLNDASSQGSAKQYFDSAINSYEKVIEDYRGEKYPDTGNVETYGEIAFNEARELSRHFGAQKTLSELTQKQLELYPESEKNLQVEVNSISSADSTLASDSVQFDGSVKHLRLVELSSGSDSRAEFNIEGERVTLDLSESHDLFVDGILKGKIVLEELERDRAIVRGFCARTDGALPSTGSRFSFAVGAQTQQVCNVLMRLDVSNVEEVARLRILPLAKSVQSATNFSVNIGIEKRAIQLAPDKTQERIDELNKTIQDWEKITDNLGNVVTGLKTACFATSALLTFKNFASGLSGESIARQEIMNGPNGWKSVCGDDDACYLQHAGEIDRDVAAYTNALNGVNQRIQQIQGRHTTTTDVFGNSVDSDALKVDLANEARGRYRNVVIDTSQLQNSDWKDRGQITVNELLEQENIASGSVSVESIRQIMLYSELQNAQLTDGQRANLRSKMTEVAKQVNDGRQIQMSLNRERELNEEGLASPVYARGESGLKAFPIVRAGTALQTRYPALFAENVTHSATFVDDDGKIYVLGLQESDARQRIYTTKKVVERDTGVEVTDVNYFLKKNSLGNLKAHDALSYSNEIASIDRKVKYYETEPYKGMPAIVPFDVRNGWYAGTRQTLPAFGGIGAFDSSGRVTSFWVCNVGENNRIEFESGLGDDLCQQVNLNTGQPLGTFPGLSETQARSLIQRAQTAIQDAARQYANGVKQVRILGEAFEVGPPSTGVPGTKCQDFMSPQDCHLLFNVCDPVVCPNSRCDLGGTYPVANVVQTGIIGSALLCLPNIREGIAIPVCLTGIHAGIEAFTSILRNHRDCLQNHLETGELVGICDEIYSIYLCEFFWGQIAPFVNVLIPKMIEIAYGQGVRGGGEYLTVNSAWQNMEGTINYFTQSYAQNSFNAFQARSGVAADSVYGTGVITEIGGQFCKNFVSAKAPNAFKSLVEPDSPPQFHAWFDSKTLTSATVPATAQYKVFYHIFGGNDQGVSYQVYLRNPPTSSFFGISDRVQVASGFIPRGEYASQTRDFTAPEGYKELCVNINGDEECGFKQVSTSFAVNYLRDGFVDDELQNTRITSENECVSGGRNPGALLQPNLQSGVEEIVSPEIYNRGIVRICATQNPGTGTQAERYVNVGHCGDPKIGCWLDVRSVDRALTESNIGLRNETLSVLTERAKNYESIQALGQDEIIAEIQLIERKLNKLSSSSNILGDGQDILNQVEFLFEKTIFGTHKARLLLINARTNAKIALHFKNANDENTRNARTAAAGGSGGGVAGPEQIDIPSWADKIDNEDDFRFVVSDSLETNQNWRGWNLMLNGQRTNYFLRYDTPTRKILVDLRRGDSIASLGAVSQNGRIYLNYYTPLLVEESLGGADEARKLNGAYVNNFNEFVTRNGIDVSTLPTTTQPSTQPASPTSQPSPQPTQCELNFVMWRNSEGERISSAAEGELVQLSVDAISNSCLGKQIDFEIYEDSVFSNRLVASFGTLVSFSGQQTVEWQTQFLDDGFFGGDPEYYFIASIVNSEVREKSGNNLKVTQAEGGAPATPQTQDDSKYYRTILAGGNRLNIYLGDFVPSGEDRTRIREGDRNTALYILQGRIYYTLRDTLVATITQGNRINVPQSTFENSEGILDGEALCYLRDLNNKITTDMNAMRVQVSQDCLNEI